MPRILAIDWDQREARYVLASAAKGAVEVLDADVVPLIDTVESGSEPRPDLAAAMRAAFSSRKFRSATTLVAVGRSGTEMLLLTLPPAGDAEMPEMVLNQAMRESASISDESALDFLVLGGAAATEPRRVVALALAPDEQKRVEAATAAAGLKPAKIVFRPFAAASLALRHWTDGAAPCLIVNRIGDETDLVVISGGKPLFTRTVRLPQSDDEGMSVSRLVGEISRTLVIAAPELPPASEVKNVLVFGRDDEHTSLLEKIREELSIEAQAIDPFRAGQGPSRSGPFAALMGTIADEAAGVAHAVDFLNPKKKPAPPNRRRTALLAGVLVGILALGGGYQLYSRLAELDAENERLAARLAELDGLARKVMRQNVMVATMRAWEGREVNWLDELRDLSRRFPSGRDMLVLRMGLTPGRSAGGSIDFQGVVRDDAVVAGMERDIRDPFHAVQSRRVQESQREKDYTWQFEATIAVRPRSAPQYAGLAPAGPAAGVAAARRAPAAPTASGVLTAGAAPPGAPAKPASITAAAVASPGGRP